MAKVEGPEIVPFELPPEGETLRKLFLADYDKCHCRLEMFDMDMGHPLFFLDERHFRLASTNTTRAYVSLREEPLTVEDFQRCFVEVAQYVDDTPLTEKDLEEVSRLVPAGSTIPGIEVPGLPFPLSVPEPLYVGQYIQNYSRFGLFIQPYCLSRSLAS